MSDIAYTYSVIRYVHDPVAGESLNIGVVLWAPDERFLRAKIDQHYGRLSKTFATFDGARFKRSIDQFEAGLGRLNEWLDDRLFPMPNPPKSLVEVVAAVWPDPGLSFQMGPVLAGVTDDPEFELEDVYDRMVASQHPSAIYEHRSDDDVWKTFNTQLHQFQISRRLTEKSIETKTFAGTFKHAFKNERWHILEPVTTHYATPSAMQDRATKWLGTAIAIKDSPEIGDVYLLLGQPRPGHERQYEKTKALLRMTPMPHQIIEEKKADRFAKQLAEYMEKHKVPET